jgi:hypothetical protein
MKEEYEIYGDLINEYRPSIKYLIFQIIYKKFLEKNRGKESIYADDLKFRIPLDETAKFNVRYIAVIKNEEVIEMIRVNEETARLLISDGIKLIGFDPQEVCVTKGMKELELIEAINE